MAEAAEGIRARFGFGGEAKSAMPLDEVEIRRSRLKRPTAFGDLFTDDKYERVSRAMGKAYRDVVRGFYGRFENPPDLVARPRDCSEVETVLNWAEAEGAAVIPFGGGTSVVGGVEPRLGDRPTVTLDAGSRLTWDFRSRQSHAITVRAGPERFGVPARNSDAVSHEFDEPGTYDIVCALHAPGMRMTVVVR
ncbi:MAG TPA: FAD-binding protein [Solirubrobacterales bacterium]|nr:FAD-binding protein [Solirubrobacterales bacterium]